MRSNPVNSSGPKLRPVHLLFLLVVAIAPASAEDSASFTLAVIPDRQNYTDFRHQTTDEFVIRLDDFERRFRGARS